MRRLVRARLRALHLHCSRLCMPTLRNTVSWLVRSHPPDCLFGRITRGVHTASAQLNCKPRATTTEERLKARMREVISRIHPDLFQTDPKARAVNEVFPNQPTNQPTDRSVCLLNIVAWSVYCLWCSGIAQTFELSVHRQPHGRSRDRRRRGGGGVVHVKVSKHSSRSVRWFVECG
jgi:hypothetical protein